MDAENNEAEPQYRPPLTDIERRFILSLRANGYTLEPYSVEGHPVIRLTHTAPSVPGKAYIGVTLDEAQ